MAHRRKNESVDPGGKKTRAVRSKDALSAEAAARRQAATLDLHAFTVDFFTQYGSPPELLEAGKPHGALRVRLQDTLAQHFGAHELMLAFQRVEAGSGQQLVAHGSRVFDAMLSWLERQGASAVRRLPMRFPSSEGLLQALRPRNAGISGLKLNDSREPVYVFYWRVTYRADDKREEIFVVALDEVSTLVAAGLLDGLAGSKAREKNAGMIWLREALQASEAVIDEHAATLERDGADVHIVEGVRDDGRVATPGGFPLAAGQPSVRMPPVTHLVRLAEEARKYVTWHADVRCVQHETEILPRLYKIANRLTGYYEQQMEEVNGNQNGAVRRETLEADLARKIEEEVENHRLRVHLELCGYLLLYTPVATAEMQISDGRRRAQLRVQMDRFTGILHRPHCSSCGNELHDVVLCRNGHLVCDGCLRQCEGCGDGLCASCGVETCPACGKQNCAECGRECRACGQRACADHIEQCPVCFDEVCLVCQEACAECGMRQCRSHLRADAVLEEDDSTRLICTGCAIRCSGCQQYSARIDRCALSGQRFCRNCLVTCSQCQRMIGPGFYGTMKSGRVVCRECVHLCGGCSQPAEAVSQCTTCGEECCDGCRGQCDACGDFFCVQHYARASGCGHLLCSVHALECHVGHETVCPRCSVTCAICDRAFCTHHSVACTICGKYYCSACVEKSSDVCRTCAGFVTGEATAVDLLREPHADLPDIQALAKDHGWQKRANRDLSLYLGVNARDQRVLIAVRNTPGGGRYVTSRRLTWIDLEHLAQRRNAFKTPDTETQRDEDTENGG